MNNKSNISRPLSSLPKDDAHLAGCFFDKPLLTLQQQADLLIERGLLVKNEHQRDRLLRYLAHVGYYRLSAYTRYFSKSCSQFQHQFYEDITVEKLISLYKLDRHLRKYWFDGLEQIEISVKATLNHTLSEQLGIHWYENPNAYYNNLKYASCIERLKSDMRIDQPHDKQEVFISHYLKQYKQPELPVGWMMIQTLHFGSLSKLYTSLSKKYQKEVAAQYGLSPQLLAHTLHSFTVLRNTCAHHGRVFNREFGVYPLIPDKLKKQGIDIGGAYELNPRRMAAYYSLACYLFKTITPSIKWTKGLVDLIENASVISYESLGFTRSINDYRELICITP